MNKEGADTLKKLYRQLRKFERSVRAQMSDLRHMQAAFMNLAQTCDHKRPNGKTAIKLVKCCDECQNKVRACQVCFRVIEKDGPQPGAQLLEASPEQVKNFVDQLPPTLKALFSGAQIIMPKGQPPGLDGNPSRN